MSRIVLAVPSGRTRASPTLITLESWWAPVISMSMAAVHGGVAGAGAGAGAAASAGLAFLVAAIGLGMAALCGQLVTRGDTAP